MLADVLAIERGHGDVLHVLRILLRHTNPPIHLLAHAHLLRLPRRGRIDIRILRIVLQHLLLLLVQRDLLYYGALAFEARH